MKEPFTIQMDRLVLVMGRDVVDDLGRQVRAHDPSLPRSLEEQLRELMARPARSSESVATIALEALDYVESLRRVLACLPSAETLNAAVRAELGREPTAEECAAILAVIDELSRSVVRALTPRIAIDPPSIMPPSPPPPPPPTKAQAGGIPDALRETIALAAFGVVSEVECGACSGPCSWAGEGDGKACENCLRSYADRMYDKTEFDHIFTRVSGRLNNTSHPSRDGIRGAFAAVCEWALMRNFDAHQFVSAGPSPSIGIPFEPPPPPPTKAVEGES